MAQPSVIGPIKPYFTYAAQMKDSVPIMAYHCKLFAVKKGLALCNASPGEGADKAKSYLVQELGDLEAMKAAMGDVAQEDLKFHVENFVLSVFAQTDKEERTCETITRKNAVDFKRTKDFIELLDLFEGAMNDEWAERRKYCVYKAGTIMKALKEGTEPERGNPFAPPEEEKKQEESQQFDGMGGMPEIPSAPIAPLEIPGGQQPDPTFNMPMIPQEPIQQPNYQPQAPSYMPHQDPISPMQPPQYMPQ